METRILFCEDCVDRILNEKILSFWQSMCISRIVNNSIFDLGNREQTFLDMAKSLEFMGYAVTTDNEEGIICMPYGIEKVEEDLFLICCCDYVRKR